MRKIFCLLSLFLSFGSGAAENIGSLFVGYSVFPGNADYSPCFRTNSSLDADSTRVFENGSGVSVGFLLPINFPRIQAHYKVRAAYHEIVRDRLWHDDWTYISASNVFLAGYEWRVLQDKLHLLPQLGLGLIYENIYSRWGTGYVYNLLFVDYSLRVGSPLLKQVDFLVNWEAGIAKSQGFQSPDAKLHFSLVVKI